MICGIYINMCVCVYNFLVPKSCPALLTPWTVAHQAPLSMGFFRQEYWNGLPFPSPGDYMISFKSHHNPIGWGMLSMFRYRDWDSVCWDLRWGVLEATIIILFWTTAHTAFSCETKGLLMLGFYWDLVSVWIGSLALWGCMPFVEMSTPYDVDSFPQSVSYDLGKPKVFR